MLCAYASATDCKPIGGLARSPGAQIYPFINTNNTHIITLGNNEISLSKEFSCVSVFGPLVGHFHYLFFFPGERKGGRINGEGIPAAS